MRPERRSGEATKGEKMAIRCGKGHEHETVAEVRACYAVGGGEGSAPAVRSNKFAGTCVKCGHRVEAQAGRIERNAESGWDVFHLDGTCPEKIAVPETAMAGLRAPAFREDFKNIPAGHYATASLTGKNDYDFWRVDCPAEGRWAGRIFVKRIIGGKPEAPVRGATRFGALSAIITEGIEVCGTRYGVELGQCRKCNRHLTDETSRALGIGPDCRSQGA